MSDLDFVRELNEMDHRVDDLIALCERLMAENQAMRHRQEQINSERAHLLRRHEQARSRVEAMISQLKSMENH